jgi:NADH:ubiquinone oxidoreductase subunit E
MKTIEEILSKYKEASQLIDILSEVQAEYGYVSEENMLRIEQVMHIPLVEIYGVVTFYAAFKLKPFGKYKIIVCDGTACHVKGSKKLAGAVKDELGIDEGGITSDGIFSLELVRCLGLCASSPVFKINDVVYAKCTKEKVKQIIDEYRSRG